MLIQPKIKFYFHSQTVKKKKKLGGNLKKRRKDSFIVLLRQLNPALYDGSNNHPFKFFILGSKFSYKWENNFNGIGIANSWHHGLRWTLGFGFVKFCGEFGADHEYTHPWYNLNLSTDNVLNTVLIFTCALKQTHYVYHYWTKHYNMFTSQLFNISVIYPCMFSRILALRLHKIQH